jgi:hypothetical protein
MGSRGRPFEKWVAAFDGWRTELDYLPGYGRPGGTGKVDAVRALIEGERYLSRKKIAQMLDVTTKR